jgi:hypothetical protein
VAGVIGRLASWLGKYALLAAFLGIAALWTYSHLFPESLGSCHEVPVTIGAKATVRDCQAIPTTDSGTTGVGKIPLRKDFGRELRIGDCDQC